MGELLLHLVTNQPIPAGPYNVTYDLPHTIPQDTTDLLDDQRQDDPDGSSRSMRDVDPRITTLWILFASGVIGNTLALIWLWHRRHRKSRVLKIIFGLVTADLSVCFFVMLFSAVYEMMGYRWLLGNISCKLMMFSQTTVISASSYMLVLLASDRHMAVRSPMKGSYPTTRLVVLVWVFAATLSIPQLRVWEMQEVQPGFNTCKTILGNPKDDPRVFIYLLYATIMTFCVPFIITSIAYMRICKKIWDKARESSAEIPNGNPCTTLVDKQGRVRLQRSGARTLQQAKGKTLRMSITIITMFLLCGFPYFLVGMLRIFASVSHTIDAIFGIFAVANSSINPYIFLWFSQKSVVSERLSKCRRLCACFSRRKINQPAHAVVACTPGVIAQPGQPASSGGLTQDSTSGGCTQTTARSIKASLTPTASGQQDV